MLEIFEQTIANQISFQGIGLHSGKKSRINILPGNDGSGIKFKRIDLDKNNIISAKYNNVTSAQLCTTLENESGVKVSTVEHLLAAFYIAGIDNALIEIDNEEVPIMDGSAKDFLEILSRTEIKIQNKKRKYLKILKKIELNDGERNISIEPLEKSFEVYFELNYNNKIIGNQKNLINFDKENLENVYSSRTFCLYQDIEKIKNMGLAKGGSLENALVVDEKKILNEGGLRNEKEFVNHKILDLAGDFILSGHRILGKVNCYHGGHKLSNLFLRKMMEEKNSFSLISETKSMSQKEFIDEQSEKIAAFA
jgi:UDP-3-O-[3-hydroxymyristoyl] N-acetylglucosamine deacetylase